MNKWMMRGQRLLLLALLPLVLVACSGAQFGYRFLDDLMHWEVDKYLDLDSQQNDWLKKRLDAFHAWHKQDQLPLYITFLQQQTQRLEQAAVTPAQLQQAMDQGYALIRNSTRQLLPDLTELAAGLTAEQVETFLRNYDRKAREYEEERILPAQDKRRTDRIERMEEVLEKWIGKVSPEQQPLLASWADGLDYATEPRMAQRRHFRQLVASLLQQRDKPAQFSAGLQKLVVFLEQQYLPEYRQYEARNRQHTLTFLASLYAQLTETQKTALRNNLGRYQRDFENLIR